MITWAGEYIDNANLGETATQIGIKFSASGALVDEGTWTIVATGSDSTNAIWTTPVSVTCSVTVAGGAKAATCTTTDTQTLVVTASEAGGMGTGAVIVTVTSNIAANKSTFNSYKFIDTASGGGSAGDGFPVGSPRFFFRGSECRT